jgi:hypothetical protein
MGQSIVTVTVPATSYDLIDMDTVKEELDITTTTNDSRLQRWIAEESARVSSYCDRVFQMETLSEVIRLPYAAGTFSSGAALQLARWPIISVTSVTEGTSLLATTAYEVKNETGQIFRISGTSRSNWAVQPVTVVYTAGYATIPADVSQACLALMKQRTATLSPRDPSLRQLQIEGIGRKDYYPVLPEFISDMPVEVIAALRRYRNQIA